MATVSDLFKSLGLTPWWNNITQGYNGSSELGTDFNAGGFGANVGAIAPGRVVYVGAPYANDPNHSSLDYVVQVLSPDGRLYHYQHLWTPSVSVGDPVQAGTIVGTQGGCPTAGGWYAGSNGCPNGYRDDWTTGSHIEVRESDTYNSKSVWSQNWHNPLPTFQALAGGGSTAIPTSSGGASSSSTPSSSSSGPNYTAFAQKAGIFTLALILIGFGVYTLFPKEVGGALGHMPLVKHVV